MATWTNITDAQVDPDAPLTSELAYAWRDNPVAITEGAAGAPKIQDAALGSTVTTAGSTWVGARIAAGASNSIGSYAMAYLSAASTSAVFGDDRPGSALSTSSAAGGSAGGSLPGTWRCQGRATLGAGDSAATTIWKRIS